MKYRIKENRYVSNLTKRSKFFQIYGQKVSIFKLLNFIKAIDNN
jgi:hypothetical protein